MSDMNENMTDQSRTDRPVQSPSRMPAILGFFFGIGVGLAVVAYMDYRSRHPTERFVSQPAAGEAEFQELWGKVVGFDVANGRRPESLNELGHSAPGVLYFPAVLKSDPPDMIVLCTLLVRREKDKYLVMRNDGALMKMDAQQLKLALGRTYDYIGQKIEQASPRTP